MIKIDDVAKLVKITYSITLTDVIYYQISELCFEVLNTVIQNEASVLLCN